MKRFLALVLVLLLAIPALPALAIGSSKEITLYGDGSKKVIDVTDKFGRTYHYYDIYEGAKKRMDANDPTWFMEKILCSEIALPGLDKQSIIGAYDKLLFNDLIESVGLRWHDLSLKQILDMFIGNGYVKLDPTHVIQAGGTVDADSSIRENFTKLIRQHVDSTIYAHRIKPIEGLRKIAYNGPTFYSLNVTGIYGKGIFAYGSVFYDIQFRYIEDKKQADSAVGGEMDINKLKGKRGFDYSTGNFRTIETAWAENRDKVQATRKVEATLTRTVGIENTVSTTNETSSSLMIGAEAKATLKVPLVGSAEFTAKTEYTTSRMASTTNGKSTKFEETNSFTSGVEVPLKPRTKAMIEFQMAESDMGIEYDYPIAVSYKVAQYVIANEEFSQLVAVWGANSSDQRFAPDNMRERWDHRNSGGYEDRYGSDYPLDWSKMPNVASQAYFQRVRDWIPMSITGGKLELQGRATNFIIHPAVPMAAIGELSLSGPNQFVLPVNGTLNLTSAVGLEAYDTEVEGDPVDYYGFDEKTSGKWILCDANGKPAESALAALETSTSGTTLLKAANQAGTVYVRYQPDPKELSYVDDNDQLAYTNVAEIDNDTLVRVDIVGASIPFNGTVELMGPVNAEVRTPLDLRRMPEAVKVSNPDGQEVNPLVYPLQWSIVGGNTADVKIESNVLTAYKSGDYKIQVSYNGVASKEATLHVSKGAAATGVQLNRNSLVMNKYDYATLSATVLPVNADDHTVQWNTSDPSVATVDQTGKVKAIGTGFAQISATTNDGGHVAYCLVEVQTPDPGTAVDSGKIAMVKGTTKKLSTPGGAKGTWKVEDTSIATINSSRQLKAKALGMTDLTFTVTDAKNSTPFRGKSLKAGDVLIIPLVVRNSSEVAASVSLKEKSTIWLAPGESKTLTATVKPGKAKDKEVFYKTSDKTVALVDDSGLIIGVGSGKATITATTCTGKQAKVTVQVTNDIQAILLNATKKSMLVGDAFQITAMPKPAGLDFEPYFVSSDPTVASVDQRGIVTAVKPGKATISVHRARGSQLKSTISVTVR